MLRRMAALSLAMASLQLAACHELLARAHPVKTPEEAIAVAKGELAKTGSPAAAGPFHVNRGAHAWFVNIPGTNGVSTTVSVNAGTGRTKVIEEEDEVTDVSIVKPAK